MVAPLSKIVSVTLGGATIDLGDDEDEDDDSWWTEDLASLWHGLEHNYYAVLGLSKDSSNSHAVCAAYHRVAHTCHPHRMKQSGARARRAALLSFYMVTEAFMILRDRHRKRVYDECGLKALRLSESYSAESAFEADPIEVFDRFYSGDDAQSRDFLLSSASSIFEHDDEDDDESEKGGEVDEVEMGPLIAVNPSLDSQRSAVEAMQCHRDGLLDQVSVLNLFGTPLAEALTEPSIEPEFRDIINAALSNMKVKAVQSSVPQQRRHRQKRCRRHRVHSKLLLLRRLSRQCLAHRGRSQQSKISPQHSTLGK